jgi:hypothetical protein
MIKFGERDFTRIKLIIRDTDRDKGIALKFLNKGGYVPTTRENVIQGILDQYRRGNKKRRRYNRKGGLNRVMKVVPGMFLLTAEKPI